MGFHIWNGIKYQGSHLDLDSTPFEMIIKTKLF